MITLVDYGLGNIQAFANIYKRLNIPVTIANTVNELEKATKIILPGVGAFDWAMTRLNESGLRDCLDELVIDKKRPVVGVCVGMQMMAGRSDEGKLKGLGWFDAEVKRFDKSTFTQATHLPHMGWNDVVPTISHPILNGLEKDARFYFLHSYYFAEVNSAEVLTQTDYNGLYTSGVHRNNIFGVQFHPEKSHHWGVQLLKNFAELSIC